MKKEKELFTSALYLSTFTFGGGYVIIPLMKQKFVDELGWIDEDEMTDLIAIAQSSPGSIAINASILVGYKIAGFKGAIVSCLGTMLPPLFILSIISLFYVQFRNNRFVGAALRTMQAGVGAVILDVVVTMGSHIIKKEKIIGVILMSIAFIAAYFLKINVLIIIILSGLIGAIRFLRSEKT